MLKTVFTFWSVVENKLEVFSGQWLRKTGIDNTWYLMAGRASKRFNVFLSDEPSFCMTNEEKNSETVDNSPHEGLPTGL